MEHKLAKEGLAIPNVKKYYHAACLAACLNWFKTHDAETTVEETGPSLDFMDWVIKDRPTFKEVGQTTGETGLSIRNY